MPRKKEDLHSTTIRMQSQNYSLLRMLSSLEKRSVSKIVDELVEEYIKKNKSKLTRMIERVNK